MAELPRFADAEILAERGSRAAVDPAKPYAFFVEREPKPISMRGREVAGSPPELEEVAAIFTTNAECSFRCLMCDLWKNTTVRGSAPAPVADQVAWALARCKGSDPTRPPPHVKIYNAGSFFDTASISRADREQIAKLVTGRRSLIVECHPRLVDRACEEFAAALAPVELQVAMGLETVDPVVLSRLNKGMELSDFERAARFLTDRGVAVRAFVLLGPPGHRGDQAVDWAKRSIDYAFSLGVECCVVIPVRPGNGIVDRLEREGHFVRSNLAQLETVLAYGLALRGGRVMADVWDLEDFFDCSQCSEARAATIRRMNGTQLAAPLLECGCQGSSA